MTAAPASGPAHVPAHPPKDPRAEAADVRPAPKPPTMTRAAGDMAGRGEGAGLAIRCPSDGDAERALPTA